MRKDDKTKKLLLRLEDLRVKIARGDSPVKEEKTEKKGKTALSESLYQTLKQSFSGGGFQVFDPHLVFLAPGV